MNSKRFMLAVVAVFIATFVTDYLIHGLWLEGDYAKTIDLWRSDPEIMLNFSWTTGSQLLAAILIVGIWAMGFAEGASLQRACLFGVIVGLLRQTDTLTDYAVQPIPASLALKWFVSGIAQSVLLALIAYFTYKPMPATSPGRQIAGERRWFAAAILTAVIIAVAWMRKSGEAQDQFDATAYLSPPVSTVTHQTSSATNYESVFMPVDTGGGRGSPTAKAVLLEELARLDTQIRERNRLFEPELKPLLDTIIKRQLKGKNVSCSLQIYREIRWWLNFTSDTNTTRARIGDLKKALRTAAAKVGRRSNCRTEAGDRATPNGS
jgi:hypothetical protein